MIKNVFDSSWELSKTLSETRKKLLFKCLSQIGDLGVREIDARDRDFAAGERSVLGQVGSNVTRDILLEEFGRNRAHFFRQGGIETDHFQGIVHGRRDVFENVVQVGFQQTRTGERRVVGKRQISGNLQSSVIDKGAVDDMLWRPVRCLRFRCRKQTQDRNCRRRR